MRYRLLAALAGTLAAALLQAQQPQYTNPVFDENTPDPTVVRAPDGTFYAYGTGGDLPQQPRPGTLGR